MSDKLIAFYSRADENYVRGMLKNLTVGNTEIVADIIAEFTGADLFKIEQSDEYSKNYNECIEQARRDQRLNARPKLKEYLENIDNYKVIYLGFPNYWGTMPMAVFTFLESLDFGGKIIKPFCTHEGSGFGNSIADIKRLCLSAKIENGFTIIGGNAEGAKQDIEKWLRKGK